MGLLSSRAQQQQQQQINLNRAANSSTCRHVRANQINPHRHHPHYSNQIYHFNLRRHQDLPVCSLRLRGGRNAGVITLRLISMRLCLITCSLTPDSPQSKQPLNYEGCSFAEQTKLSVIPGGTGRRVEERWAFKVQSGAAAKSGKCDGRRLRPSRARTDCRCLFVL